MQYEITPSLIARFWSRVEVSDPDACWLWQGATNTNGYGHLARGRTMYQAHRLSWTIHNGPIPDRMCVLHRCDVPRCVNPAHLWIGTQTDNMRDRDQKGRVARGVSHHRARLTEDQVRDIRAKHATGDYTYDTLAAMFGVGEATIWKIVTRRQWRHL
jgi:hypothetical protein